MSNALLANTTDGYRASPFGWGGTIDTIKFVGADSARAAQLARTKTAFEALDAGAIWSNDAVGCYSLLLRTYYSVNALRVHALAGGIEIEVGVAKNDIISRCTHSCVARV
jgi:hypothetical protein